VVEGFGGRQVMTERLFDDNAAPAFGFGVHAGGSEGVAGRAVMLGGGGEIVEAVGGLAFDLAQARVNFRKIGGHFEIAADVVQAAGEIVPDLIVEGAAEFLHAVEDVLAKVVGGPVAAGDADDAGAVPQAALFAVAVEGGDELAVRQVAGGAEDDDGGGVGLGDLVAHGDSFR